MQPEAVIQHPRAGNQNLHELHADRPKYVVVHQLIIRHFVRDPLRHDPIRCSKQEKEREDEREYKDLTEAGLPRMETLTHSARLLMRRRQDER